MFFLLFLLVFILGTESVRAAAGVGRETVRAETLTRALTGTGTLFFTETTLINHHNNGPVDYAVTGGATVEPDALLGIAGANLNGDAVLRTTAGAVMSPFDLSWAYTLYATAVCVSIR